MNATNLLKKSPTKGGIYHSVKSQMPSVYWEYGGGKMIIMEERVIEPGLLRVFRYYCGFAVLYFFGNFLYAYLTTKILSSSTSLLYLIDFFIFLALLGYLMWEWLEKKIKAFFLPIAILIAALAPIYTSVVVWPLPSQNPLTDIVIRSWMLFPIVIVPIVLVAWQYSLKVTLILVVLTAFYDLPFILIGVGKINLEAIPFLGVPILRSVALGIVGTVVSMLIKTQRTQRERLMEANIMLSQHTQALEQLAVSHERNRLARELHDTLAHTLSSQILTLEALKLSINPDDRELNDSLDEMVINTRKGLEDTRRALKDLRAEQLEDLGLASALKSLLADAASRTNCAAICTISENLPLLTPKVEQCMYRIAQEAVENIIRHANATTIELKLIHQRKHIILEITDNGLGFQKDSVDSQGRLGIKGMQERSVDAGGEFIINTEINKGTQIRVEFEV
jgi:signal transduction histidine kinase